MKKKERLEEVEQKFTKSLSNTMTTIFFPTIWKFIVIIASYNKRSDNYNYKNNEHRITNITIFSKITIIGTITNMNIVIVKIMFFLSSILNEIVKKYKTLKI